MKAFLLALIWLLAPVEPTSAFVTSEPAPANCRDPLAVGIALDRLPGQIDAAKIGGAAALRRLRDQRGEAPIVVRGGDFSGADLRGANLRNVCFVGTNLRGSDWRGARADGIAFLDSDLTGARLAAAHMPGVLFGGTELAGADARGADWSGGSVYGNGRESWQGLRLDRANLRRFRFECSEEYPCIAWSDGISLRGADLRGADVSSFWSRIDWTGARFDGARVSLRQLLDIGSGRFAAPFIVKEGKVEARLSPGEYAWLRPHMSATPDRPPSKGPGTRPRLHPGETALYVDPPIRFDSVARRHPLYRRLLPAFVSASSSLLRVTALRNGLLNADGDAIGGGGHVCGLDAKRLRFDGRSGWFVGMPQLKPGDRSGTVPLLRFSGNEAEVREQGHDRDVRASDFVTCGFRAAFGRMERVAVSEREIRTIVAERSER